MSALTLTLLILVISTILLLSGWLRPDLVAMLTAISLGMTGILTPQEAFSGFSRSAVITIMAIYILAEGLHRTGVTDRVGELITRMGGSQERALTVVVSFSGALLSLFMNNIAAASVLLPAVTGAARKSGVNPSRLLIPLAFGTILGGMATLLTTTNIIASNLLRDAGVAGFGLLDFAPLGIPLVIAGVLYLTLAGRRLLPAHPFAQHRVLFSHEEDNLADIYRLDERLLRARVPVGSDLIGKPLDQSNLRQNFQLNLVAIERNTQTILSPSPQATLKQGDILVLEGKPESLKPGNGNLPLEILHDFEPKKPELESQRVILVEAILAPRSALIGQTLQSTRFRQKYDLNVIAIWRAGRPIRTGLTELPLQFGDALLVLGERAGIALLRAEPDLIILNGDERHPPVEAGKGWIASLILLATIVLGALDIVPVAEIMLAGALAMILVGILPIDRAYQVIDWKSIFLIAGILPMGIAMTKSGAAASLGNWLLAYLGQAGPMILLAGLVLISVLLTQVINSAAVTAIIAPIAIGAAQQSGLDPRALVMGVALATSMTFLTPLGHPVNILVMGPGAYRVQDYFKVGLPLTLILVAFLMILFPLVWPLSGG